MVYELRCTGGQSKEPSFCHEASQFLVGLDPSLKEFDANPLSDLVDELSFEGAAVQVQVVYEGEQLPLVITLTVGQALFSVKMGVFGEEARQRVSKTLTFAFALSKKFGLEIFDAQLERDITKEEQGKLEAEVAARFDQSLDF
jgi:hypothetical protein